MVCWKFSYHLYSRPQWMQSLTDKAKTIDPNKG